jgi:acylphosphatase
VRVHLLVSGRVQGVGFRYFTARLARERGLSGFVQNLSDGRVEVLAQGDRDALEGLIAAVRQGPSGAVVRDVRVDWRYDAGPVPVQESGGDREAQATGTRAFVIR